MTISATTKGMKPGVCTSTNRPANPFDGMVIYETDTDRAMVWNNSAWVVLSTGRTNSGGLDLILVQTVGTAVSSVVVSNVFSSTYDNYRIVMRFNSSSSSGSHVMQLSNATTSNYLSSGFYQSWGTASTTAYSPGFATTWAISANTVSSAATDIVIDLFYPFASARTQGTVKAAAGNGTLDSLILENTGNSSTGFTITKGTSETITGGTIYVYGYAK